MTVKHNSTVGAGDLISSTRWNADHTISDAPTIISIPVIANPTGISQATGSSDTYTDMDNCEFYIPLQDMYAEGYNKVYLTGTIKSGGVYNSYIEIYNDTDADQLAEVGPGTSTTGSFNSGWTSYIYDNSATKTYKLRVKTVGTTGSVTVYYATLYLKKE